MSNLPSPTWIQTRDIYGLIPLALLLEGTERGVRLDDPPLNQLLIVCPDLLEETGGLLVLRRVATTVGQEKIPCALMVT